MFCVDWNSPSVLLHGGYFLCFGFFLAASFMEDEVSDDSIPLALALALALRLRSSLLGRSGEPVS